MEHLDLLEQHLARLDIPAEDEQGITSLIGKLKKQVKRLEFAVHRLQSDKEITEGFLNTTIIDLEKANAALKVYQQKELQEKEKQIRFQEIQLKQITDAMPSSLAFVDLDFKYQINNKVYVEWFGKTSVELKGKHVVDIVGTESFKKTKPLLERAFKGKKVVYDLTLKDKNSEELILHVTYIPAVDDTGKIIGAYVYGQDITRLKQNEKAIADKNEELQQYINTNLQLENFAYLASHDLRSPLSNVLNFAKLLKKSASHKLDENENKYLEFINRGSLRMKEFIEALLAYSVSSNKEIEFTSLDINHLVNEVLADLGLKIKETKAVIRTNPLPQKITGDRFLLKQLFQNLISNAIKFVDDGVAPEIIISCKDSDKAYLFSVKDNGIGIDKPYQETIFGIFKRLHIRSEYKGTGIGLSNCKNAVEKHGGKIWVESREGDGSTFYFTLLKNIA